MVAVRLFIWSLILLLMIYNEATQSGIMKRKYKVSLELFRVSKGFEWVNVNNNLKVLIDFYEELLTSPTVNGVE